MFYTARRELRLLSRRRRPFGSPSKSLIFDMKNRVGQHRQQLWRDWTARRLAPLGSDDRSRRQNDDLMIDYQRIADCGLRTADLSSLFAPRSPALWGRQRGEGDVMQRAVGNDDQSIVGELAGGRIENHPAQ